MSKSCEPRPVALSVKIYERLLVFYPREHRGEYGHPMAQLFRDQCRDAWTQGRGWGLALLWVHTAIDLAKTSMLERLRELKQRKFMLNRIVLAFRHNRVVTAFLAVFGAVFVLALGSSVLLAFLTPEQFASTARVRVQQVGSDAAYFIQTEFEVIQSQLILGRVAKELNLAESWGKRSVGGRLSGADTIKLLKDRIDLQQVRNTDFIEVRVRGENAGENANIANALVEIYREFSNEQRQSTAGVTVPRSRFVVITDSAAPGLRPVRPNKPLILFLGVFGGTFLASLVGGAGAFAVYLNRRLPPPVAAS